MGIDPYDRYRSLRDNSKANTAEAAAAVARRRLQGSLYEDYLKRSQPDVQYRVRDKFSRWHFDGRPRQLADRRATFVGHCQRHTTPRVRAAIWATLWNRWTTARRFQQRWAASNVCVFGCSPSAEDSIVHYCRCRLVIAAHKRFLRLHPAADGSLLEGWIFGGAENDPQVHTRYALGAYATYRAFNQFRFNGGSGDSFFYDVFNQLLKEGAMRHTSSEKALASTWITPKAATKQRGSEDLPERPRGRRRQE